MKTRALITTFALSLLAGNVLAANLDAAAVHGRAGSLPAVQVNAARFGQGSEGQDYTGVAAQPSAAAIAAAPVWTTESARDYTGVVAPVSERNLSAIAPWNSADAHEYTGVVGSM